MAKIHLIANNCQIEEHFNVLAIYAISGMSLRPARA